MRTGPEGTIHFFTFPEVPHVQCVYGANVGHEFSRHVHSRFSIGIILKGERVIVRNNTETVVPENGLFVINPGESHACKPRCEKHSYFTVCVDADKMIALASQISEKAQSLPCFAVDPLQDDVLSANIRRVLALSGSAASPLERESVLVSFLSALMLRHGDTPPTLCPIGSHVTAIARACRFMEAHVAENISLKQLSDVACLSPFYFQRLFLKNKGISPHEYLVHFRVKKAMTLLAERGNIVDVAFETGFVDQSHFSHSFKRVVGVTPGRYLQNIRNHPCAEASNRFVSNQHSGEVDSENLRVPGFAPGC